MDRELPPYSVLMAVYVKEKPEYLQCAIESILNQTYQTDDFVLVCDGPLTEALNAVIAKYASKLHVVRLPQNVGTGSARNAGLETCRHDFVAIMDSDDISMPNRCLMQMSRIAENKEIAILGGQMSEFVGSPDHIIAVKSVPTDHQDILKYAKRRDPFNNSTVILNRNIALMVGGYSQLSRCEDYMLYATILQKGHQTENLDTVLSSYRLADDTYERRGTIDSLKGFVSVRWKLHRMGFSSFMDFVIPCCGQMLYTVLPLELKKMLYQSIIRKERSF